MKENQLCFIFSFSITTEGQKIGYKVAFQLFD